MVSFVVIGEGSPARALLDAMVANSEASVNAVALEAPENNPLTEFSRLQGIPVFNVRDFSAEVARKAAEAGAWLINVNSTYIIPSEILDLFEGRSLNFHPGLLPEYAGLHTHQWAIRNGEREFGVTVHRMEERIDAGDIVGQARFPISPDDTGLSLFGRCLAAGAELFPRIIAQIVRGEPLTEIRQDVTRRRLYRHRDALEDRIDWNEDAQRIVDFIRAGNYEPFISPTYVARLDVVGGFDIKVLRALKEQGPHAEPGAIIEISDAGPLIACGNGGAIRILRARCARKLVTHTQWHEYVSHLPDRRLRGRSEVDG